MRYWIQIPILLFITHYNLLAHEGDTIKIVFFQDSNIQQFRGVEWHRITKKIPKGTYRKAILKIDLGCATYGCCAWDYTYRGFFDSKMDSHGMSRMEVARLITPYSSFMRKNKNGFDSAWTHPYIYDVTDFLPLLKQDSIIYSALTGGWDNKGNFGFKHTVTLYLIKGKNTSPIERIITIYNDAYRYQDSSQFDLLTKPYVMTIEKEATQAKFRMLFTGHDQQGEFSPITFYLKRNGIVVYKKRMWKEDCDQNAIQPQSGTWIFSRCNWCPGEKVQEIEVDMTPYLKLGENQIDIALGKIESADSPILANYMIRGALVQYSAKPDYDAELVEIISPNNDPRFKLHNPICQNSSVRVKNTGSKIITALHFEYFTSMGAIHKYSWSGKLTPEESIDISLPLKWTIADYASSRFDARMIRSLQNRDGSNDTLSSKFRAVPVISSRKIAIEIQTTNDSSVNTFELYNSENQRIYYKNYYNNSTTYRDTFPVTKGCYKMHLLDRDRNYACGDGLSFWYSSMAYKKTSGIFKLLDAENGMSVKVFNPDFGKKIHYQFIIENELK